MIYGQSPGEGRQPGPERPQSPQPVPTRRCWGAEIKGSCSAAGKCKCSWNELLIVKPQHFGVIIPCAALSRPGAPREWAPGQEDVSCLRLRRMQRSGERCGNGGRGGREVGEVGKESVRGAVAQIPWGSHGDGDPLMETEMARGWRSSACSWERPIPLGMAPGVARRPWRLQHLSPRPGLFSARCHHVQPRLSLPRGFEAPAGAALSPPRPPGAEPRRFLPGSGGTGGPTQREGTPEPLWDRNLQTPPKGRPRPRHRSPRRHLALPA